MIRRTYLTPNQYSRPGLKLRRIDAVVLHWVENPGSSAEANRRYFEALKDGSRKASAHYIIDNTEIVQCVPDDEVAHHCGQSTTDYAIARWGGEYVNWYSIGIEHCHPDVSGIWEPMVLRRSHVLCAGLCLAYGLDPLRDIIRHYDVTKKDCPRWFVTDSRAFARYKDVVSGIMEA